MKNKVLKKEKIWIVSEVFFPEEVATSYILTEIAISISKDFEVHVICGPESYEKELKGVNYSKLSDIRFHRINKFNFDKNKLITRAFRLMLLSIAMFLVGLVKIKKNEKVLVVTNPATIIPLYALLRLYSKFKLYFLIHDVFPENLVPAKILSSKNIFYKILKYLYNSSYKMAFKLIVLGRDMKSLMLEKTKFKNEDIYIIENWADLETVHPISNEINLKYSNNFNDKIVIQYAGNFGRLQDLDKFLLIFAKSSNPRLHLVLVGRGAMENQLRAIVKEKKLTNVTIEKPFRRIEQNEYINACDIGLVTLTDELYGLGVPSKSYNILAAQKPILFIGRKNTEVALMIKESKCGYSFEFNEEVLILDFLNNLDFRKNELLKYAKNARSLALNKYSKDIILNKFKIIFTENV